jgi:hypothetical protein
VFKPFPNFSNLGKTGPKNMLLGEGATCPKNEIFGKKGKLCFKGFPWFSYFFQKLRLSIPKKFHFSSQKQVNPKFEKFGTGTNYPS